MLHLSKVAFKDRMHHTGATSLSHLEAFFRCSLKMCYSFAEIPTFIEEPLKDPGCVTFVVCSPRIQTQLSCGVDLQTTPPFCRPLPHHSSCGLELQTIPPFPIMWLDAQTSPPFSRPLPAFFVMETAVFQQAAAFLSSRRDQALKEEMPDKTTCLRTASYGEPLQ